MEPIDPPQLWHLNSPTGAGASNGHCPRTLTWPQPLPCVSVTTDSNLTLPPSPFTFTLPSLLAPPDTEPAPLGSPTECLERAWRVPSSAYVVRRATERLFSGKGNRNADAPPSPIVEGMGFLLLLPVVHQITDSHWCITPGLAQPCSGRPGTVDIKRRSHLELSWASA